jgi:histidinol-phosphate/aromatic aminotransferase/cobyric acid decarboxylase-like protein
VRECSNKIGSSERYLRLAVQTNEAADLLVQALRRELSLAC